MDSSSKSLQETQSNADPQVGIDEDILDFLVYKALKAQLREARVTIEGDGLEKSWPSKANLELDLVDSFLKIYHATHPKDHGHQILQFRMRLLRFTTLFTMRWSRELCRHRKSKHLASAELPEDTNQKQTYPSAASEDRPMSGKVLPYTSLLSTLPSFMALSAAANAMQRSRITDTWMRLAAGYMAQAVVEQHITFDCQDSGIMGRAFRWGFDPDTLAEEGTDEFIINAMFLDEWDEFTSWRDIKNDHMLALRPPDGIGLSRHFRLLQENELSFPKFNDAILQFLKGLSRSLPRPLLLSTDPTTTNHLQSPTVA